MNPPKTVYVSIGNSDDKLTQVEWSAFCKDVTAAIGRHGFTVYGPFFTAGDAERQSMCVGFSVPSDLVSDMAEQAIRDNLDLYRERYRQDAIAWVSGYVELIDWAS